MMQDTLTIAASIIAIFGVVLLVASGQFFERTEDEVAVMALFFGILITIAALNLTFIAGGL